MLSILQISYAGFLGSYYPSLLLGEVCMHVHNIYNTPFLLSPLVLFLLRDLLIRAETTRRKDSGCGQMAVDK